MSGKGLSNTAWLRRTLPALLICLFGLTGCAPDFGNSPNAEQVSLVDGKPYARLEQGDLIADDGTKLPARIWAPIDRNGKPVDPRAVIVALHGMNDYSNAYAIPAPVWAEQGILTFAYDQRGFGQNPYRGRWPGARALCQDFATAIRLAQRKWPGVPVYGLGESMGGAVILDAMGGHTGAERPTPNGIVLVAPAVYARSTMPIPYRVALWLGSRLIPEMSFTGAGLHVQASDNIPMLIALGRDPHYIRATRTDTIYGLVDLMDEAYAAKPDPSLPVFLLYGAKDQVIPKEPMKEYLAKILTGRPDIRVGYYPEGWHLLLRDLDYLLVANDVTAWIGHPANPLPSGADRDAKHLAPVLKSDGTIAKSKAPETGGFHRVS